MDLNTTDEQLEKENLSARAQEDYELVKRALAGDEQSYTILYERYRQSVFHTVQKMVRQKDDADDLVSEAFTKAFTKLDSYTPKYAFSTWLLKITTNNCIDYIRKKRLNLFSIDETVKADGDADFSQNVHAGSLDPEELFIQTQKVRLMRSVLSKLDVKYRLMIELRFFEERSYEEIAQELEIPIGTVKAQLHRAKITLYELLAPKVMMHFDAVLRKKK